MPSVLFGVRPHLDLFATSLNHKLDTFVSPVPDPLAYAVDVMSISWKGMFAYAFPPFRFLSQVLQKVAHSYCTGFAKTSLVHRSVASLVCNITSSTEIVYDAKWSILVNWCVGREIDPIKVSVQQLANVCVHLFEDKGLLPSTT
jgi:hypothetical protein